MGYVIKLVSENGYLIPDGDGGIITTKSKKEAIDIGSFDDFNSADETAKSFSSGMVQGVDYRIESISSNPYHVIQITVPEERAPKLKGLEKFVKNKKASVFLTNKTSEKDALNGFTRYGVSTGASAVLLTKDMYEKSKENISEYLNERFGSEWQVDLIPVDI